MPKEVHVERDEEGNIVAVFSCPQRNRATTPELETDSEVAAYLQAIETAPQ